MLPIMQSSDWNPLGLITQAFVSLLQCTQWQQSRLEAQDRAEKATFTLQGSASFGYSHASTGRHTVQSVLQASEKLAHWAQS